MEVIATVWSEVVQKKCMNQFWLLNWKASAFNIYVTVCFGIPRTSG